MTAAWLVALMLTAAPLDPAAEEGEVLVYRGQMVATKGDPAETTKKFELTLLIGKRGADSASLYWTVTEQGRGAWTWPNQFGRLDLDGGLRAVGGSGPALLYDRGDGKSVVPLEVPLLTADGRAIDQSSAWEHGRLAYRTAGTDRRANLPAWLVEARNNYGVKRRLWMDKSSPVALQMAERVFIGQGQEHDLTVELIENRHLSAAQNMAEVSGFDALIKLREDVGFELRASRTDWNPDQLERLRGNLTEFEKLAADDLLKGVADAALRDLKTQKGRSNAVASLREKAIGKAAPQLKLDGLGHSGLTSADLTGKVTVLHFWEYRDVPLEEPYGQIGFLDFLSRKRQKEGVNVYGVVVHEPAEGDPGVRRRAGQSATRLKNFMNLSYPLLFDDGKAVADLGDPRIAGAKLPLFVVIGPDQRVVEYRAGLYEVQRDRGLEELDAAITKALQPSGKRE